MLQLGDLTVHAIRDGMFALDGGAMFGVVPRPLWEKKLAPDARGRVRLALRCLLIQRGDLQILVDNGMGDGWSDKELAIYGLDRSGFDLDRELAAAGTSRERITDLVLTHLHFDHAGGTTRARDGELTFPNATHHLQRRHWLWADHPSEKDAGSFRAPLRRALEKSGRLHLLEGDTELLPGVELFVSEGHTVGLQLVRLESGGRSLIFCGDLIPTHAHLKPSWSMAYDLYPLTVLEEKKLLLAEAAEAGTILFFEHDPAIAACTVKETLGEIALDEVIAL